jgi:arginase family enzyme
LTDIVTRVFKYNHEKARGLYLVNGDHNHMLSAIAGVFAGTGKIPIVVYIDLHADSRPVEDGPHSGTWCAEAFSNHWIESAYVIGLNALANSGPTLDNLDIFGAVYREYTWDRNKAGDTSLEIAAREISAEINQRHGSDFPVILSICGDSVQGLPSSAGTGTIGYSVDEVYKFIALMSRSCNVSCLTVAELKTSLQPSAAPLIGEFLTQCLHIYHQNLRLYDKKAKLST